MEAISEAASSHSVGSDLDNENDNLSDMVSANVSGRGTPNVSGRDTPISQADSQVCGLYCLCDLLLEFVLVKLVGEFITQTVPRNKSH